MRVSPVDPELVGVIVPGKFMMVPDGFLRATRYRIPESPEEGKIIEQ